MIHLLGGEIMGQIVCQVCNTTIEHYEDEKVTVLYSQCHRCCREEEK